jgi:putative hydrolase of HD superfamily
MEIQQFLEIMSVAERLKCNTRHSWTSTGRRESVAEHSWRLCLMAYFVRDKFPDVDMDKVLTMCLFHDLGEAFTGDIPSFEKTSGDEKAEIAETRRFLETLPDSYQSELIPLFDEMDELETPEAKLYKALDKLEVIIQHNEADISTWLPLEYELNLTYGAEESGISPWLAELREELQKITRDKIRAQEEP